MTAEGNCGERRALYTQVEKLLNAGSRPVKSVHRRAHVLYRSPPPVETSHPLNISLKMCFTLGCSRNKRRGDPDKRYTAIKITDRLVFGLGLLAFRVCPFRLNSRSIMELSGNRAILIYIFRYNRYF